MMNQKNHAPPIDRYDRRIIDALQRDGTLTNHALSEHVNLSPSQCSRRRSALEQAGLITGYHARVDAGRLGFTLRVIVRVTLRVHGKTDHLDFTKRLEGMPEVRAIFSVSGNSDYVLDVFVRDLEAFSDFVHEKLLVLPQVAQVQSDFVLKTMKDDHALDVSGA